MIILFLYLVFIIFLFLSPSIIFDRNETIANIKIYFINKNVDKYSKIFINDENYYVREMILLES